MASLAAGTSKTITLAAGQKLTISAGGSGVATVATGQQAGTTYGIGPAEVVIGPFLIATDISISAGPLGATYAPTSTPQLFHIGGDPAFPASVAAVKATDDKSGVAFLDSFNNAMLRATQAGGGRVTIYPGTYYSKRLVNAETRRLVDGVYLHSEVPGSTLIQAADDPTPNKSNLFEANNVHGWTIDGFTLDGNRSGSAQVQQGDTDALDNCIRIVNCRDATVRNCTLRNARQHGLIGVQTLTGLTVENIRATMNGWRGMHIHAENNKANRRSRINGLQIYRNGQSGYHNYLGLVATTNGSAVVQLPAGDGPKMALLFAMTGTSTMVRIPGAGASGGDMFATVASVNSGADQITIGTSCSATLSSVPMAAIGDTNSGLFMCYGGEELLFSNINVYEEPGNGVQFTGLIDALWTRVGQWMGTVVPGTLDRVRFAAADYSAFKTAYNALSAGNKALTSMTVDLAGEQSSEHVAGVSAFNDADNSVTMTVAAVNAVRRARVDVAYSVGSGGNLRLPSSGITVQGLTVNDCGIGIDVQQVQGIGFSNTHIRNSMLYGAWLKSTQDLTIEASCTIRDSGVTNVVIGAPVDAGQAQSLTDSKNTRLLGTFSGSGASCISMGNSANTRVLNVILGPTSVVEGGGSNAHFRQSTNYLGVTSGVGILAANQAGSGQCDLPKVFGEVARNFLGGLRLVACNGRGGAYPGAHIYDNVNPAAVSLGTATAGTGARAVETATSCVGLELIGVDFNCRDRINESYTLGLAASTAARVIACNFELETRNSTNGGTKMVFAAADTLHYGNRFNTPSSMIWDNLVAGVTTIPAT